MAMPVSDSNDVNTLVQWALGCPDKQLTDQAATAAARRLLAKAYKSLYAGLLPDRVRLSAADTAWQRLTALRAAEYSAGRLTDDEAAAFNVVLGVLVRVTEREAVAAAKALS
jgi:hypothetical protein